MNAKQPHRLLVCEIILLVVIAINIVVGLLISLSLCFVSFLTAVMYATEAAWTDHYHEGIFPQVWRRTTQ